MSATDNRENWPTDGALIAQQMSVQAMTLKSEGKSNEEIAQSMGISENYVRSLIRSDKAETVVVKYDNRSRNWSEDPDINNLFVNQVLSHMADRLKIRGHVFLNELFDELALPRTSRGQLVGWLYSEGETWWEADISSEEPDFITLKFNTQGEIWGKIEE